MTREPTHPDDTATEPPDLSESVFRVRFTGIKRDFVEIELMLDDELLTVELVLQPKQVMELAAAKGASFVPCEPVLHDRLRQLAWRRGEPALFDSVPVHDGSTREA